MNANKVPNLGKTLMITAMALQSWLTNAPIHALLLLGLAPGFLEAESFSPFRNERVVDVTGNYYVVMKRQAGPQRYRDAWEPVELTIAQRKRATPRVAPVRSKLVDVEDQGFVFDMKAGNDVDVRKGDRVLGRAKVTHPPTMVLVSSRGQGVVLLDLYGLDSMLLSKGFPAVTVLSLKGKVLHATKLQRLFKPADCSGFFRTLSGCVWWLYAAWIDEERREVVIVGKNSETDTYPLAAFRLDTGAVRNGGSKDVLRAIATRIPGGLTPALDVAIRSKLKEARPHLAAILQDAKLPLDARLRSAVFLASLGDARGKALLATSAVKVAKQLLKHPDWQDLEHDRLWCIYTYAVKHLPDVLGEGALPVLHEAARIKGYPAVVYDPFRRMGRKALPLLIKMLEDPTDVEGQVLAADVLSDIKPTTHTIIAALTKALKSAAQTTSGCPVRWVAAKSLGDIGRSAKSALPTLAKLAQDKDEDVRQAAADAIASIKR
jgi:hypothetical protein